MKSEVLKNNSTQWFNARELAFTNSSFPTLLQQFVTFQGITKIEQYLNHSCSPAPQISHNTSISQLSSSYFLLKTNLPCHHNPAIYSWSYSLIQWLLPGSHTIVSFFSSELLKERPVWKRRLCNPLVSGHQRRQMGFAALWGPAVMN